MSPASPVSITFQIQVDKTKKEEKERLTVKFLFVTNRRRDEFVAHDGDDGVLLLGFLTFKYKLASSSSTTSIRKETGERRTQQPSWPQTQNHHHWGSWE